MDRKGNITKQTCFVPECLSTVGVLFPRTNEAKKKWLESLEISDREPQRDSFVCLKHFEDGDAAGKKPLPKRIVAKDTSINTNRDKNALNKTKQNSEKGSKGKPATEKPKTRSVSYKSTSGLTEAEFDKELQKLFEKEKNYDYAEDEEQTDEDISQKQQTHKETLTEELEDIANRCRLCMENKEYLESIYNKIDEKNTIIHAMIVCLFPLRITTTDKLSKKICTKCLKSLRDFFKFRLFCLEMDKKQQKYRGIEFHYFSDNSDMADDDFEEEFELSTSAVDGNGKSNSLQKETKDKFQRSIKKESDLDELDDAELLQVLEGGRNEQTPEKSSTNKQPKVRPEYTDETNENFENITIDIVQGNVDTTSYKITATKLPITIKPVKQSSPSTKNRKRKISDNSTADIDCAKIIRTSEDEVVIMPKHIKVKMVKVPDVYVKKQSLTIGERIENDDITSGAEFAVGKAIVYLLDTQFFEADKHIYEFRLQKEEGRNLHCLSPECPSEAYQKREGPKDFSAEINIVGPHTHKPFTADENKILMFYSVLRRKMQKNKNYNFKALYEELVQLDPSLKTLVPLNGVIEGLCQYCPVPVMPKFQTFDELFDLIEEKCFYKAQFTFTDQQFYQERFECDDASKAIVFANQEQIDYCSRSKLMYVDSTFQIVKDIFPYQLVTVLAWVDNSFTPIMYAIINKHSEDIFKVIFAFLCDTLAPNLRPDEIITEYDADVYYALAETYGNSTIGGSYFSYFQYLFKATCALDLSKELETESTFRNIYYMLQMLPLLPLSVIPNAYQNVERHMIEAGLTDKMKPLLDFYYKEWMERVTPEFFCVHRIESRTFSKLVAPFKKLKNMVINSKTRVRHPATIVTLLEKLVGLDNFIQCMREKPTLQWNSDVHVAEKRMVLRAWNSIDENPKIKLLDFQQKVFRYLKCVENQLWVWGCYDYGAEGPLEINLINADHFTFAPNDTDQEENEEVQEYDVAEPTEEEENEEDFQGFLKELNENEAEYQEFDIRESAQDSAVMEAVMDKKAERLQQENRQFLKFK